MTIEDVDVVIVGGGPAGLSTALFQAHAARALGCKQRVVVLERERYPREKFCAGGLGLRGDAALSRIGVTVDVPSASVNGIAFRAQGRTTVVRDEPIGRVVRRVEFDHALAKVVQQQGIDLREGVAVAGVRHLGSCVEVETNAGVLRAQVVVGADGVRSVVRRALDFPTPRFRAQALEVDTEPVSSDLPRDVLLFDVSRRDIRGYYWDFPTVVDGKELVCRGVYALKDGAEPDNAGTDIQQVLADELRARGLDLNRCKKKRFAERGFDADARLAIPRVLLVGEAAGIDPLTGEGIAQAIQYGELAGAYLAKRARDRDFSFSDWGRLVRAVWLGRDMLLRTAGTAMYQPWLRPAFERLLLDEPAFLRVGLRTFAGRPWRGPESLAALGGVARAVARSLVLPTAREPVYGAAP